MDRLRWGVLGNAKIAREFVMPAVLASRNGTLQALATRDPAQGAAVQAHFAIADLHDSYESLLASPLVDAIYIPLPNTLHVEWTRRALAAGKHVLCEKPIAMHASEIADLIAARDRTGLVAGEAFMVAHHPQWALVREWLAAGRIGTLRVVDSVFAYNNTDAANIRNQQALGGGALRDIGVYPVVTTRIVTGQEAVRSSARIEWDENFGTDRLAHCFVEFPGFVLSFYCGTQAGRRQEIVFHGDQGFVTVAAPFNAGVYDLARVTFRSNDGVSFEERIFPQANHYLSMVENFADAVAGRAPLVFPLERSVGNQRVIDALFDSARPATPGGKA